MKKSNGFSIVEMVIIVIVVVIIAAIGWLAYTNLSAPKSNDKAQDSSKNADQVTVEKEADLYKVDSMLDDVNVEGTDGAELDSAVKSF